MSPAHRAALPAAAALLAAVALPLALDGYHVFQLTQVLVYAIALLGLNLLSGYSGQISLGHGAFCAVGAYTAAILMTRLGLPYWLAVPAGGGASLVAGLLFGLPALRLGGLHLALATFGLGLALPQLLKHKGLEAWTGGVQGIVLIKPDTPYGLPLDQDLWLYYFTLVVALLMFGLAYNLIRGRIGRALIALRDAPVAAVAMGVDSGRYRLAAFGVSALYAGVAGALGAVAVQFVAPDSYTIFFSIALLVGIVVGGLASISGALYGAVFIQFVPNIADEVSSAAPWAVYGVFLIACAYLLPQGMAGGLDRLRSRLMRKDGSETGGSG